MSSTVSLAALPFAQARFCGAEGLDRVFTLSTLRGREILGQYGVALQSGLPPTGPAHNSIDQGETPR
jgi:thiol peroxidase